MYIKLGNCRIQERDIKYIKWTSTTHSNNTRDISAVIRFRDGEEIKIMNISDEEKQIVDQYWSDEFYQYSRWSAQISYKGVNENE